ncbi:MAG: prolipoprotein diacylglyceryl transferase, partial [Vampirovibrionales bacterium]|nr:prolipoprotein diacylglyceryl transferase [Vampirovibrionales bacterium]
MHPILFYLGSFPIYAFGLMVALAVWASILLGNQRLEKLGLQQSPQRFLWFWILIPGFLGAKLWYALWFPIEFWSNPLSMLLNRGGLVWYGGVIGGLAGLIGFCKRQHLNFLTVSDALMPAFLLGLAIGRIGCLFAGCCYGAICTLPWAIAYPQGHETFPHTVHPSPLYESMGAMMLMFVLLWLERLECKSIVPAGRLTSLSLIGAGLLRFVVEATRGDVLTTAIGLS